MFHHDVEDVNLDGEPVGSIYPPVVEVDAAYPPVGRICETSRVAYEALTKPERVEELYGVSEARIADQDDDESEPGAYDALPPDELRHLIGRQIVEGVFEEEVFKTNARGNMAKQEKRPSRIEIDSNPNSSSAKPRGIKIQ